MRFGKHINDVRTWHPWWAWRPVQTITGPTVWLETVLRRSVLGTGRAKRVWDYELPEVLAREKLLGKIQKEESDAKYPDGGTVKAQAQVEWMKRHLERESYEKATKAHREA